MRQLASGQVSEVPGDKKDENLHLPKRDITDKRNNDRKARTER